MVKHNQGPKSQMMGTLFTLLLFLVFLMCALFTVLTGGRVYENISTRMEQNFSESVALQYIANKVRQGDEAGHVNVREMEHVQVLELAQELNGTTYLTWIYYMDGSIRELFAGADSGLGLADGLKVLECDGLKLEQDGRLLTVETVGEGGGSLMLSLRSAGGHDE